MSSKLIKGEKIYYRNPQEGPKNHLIEADVDPTSFFINILWLKSHREKTIFHFKPRTEKTDTKSATELDLVELIYLYANYDFYDKIKEIFQELKAYFNGTSNSNIEDELMNLKKDYDYSKKMTSNYTELNKQISEDLEYFINQTYGKINEVSKKFNKFKKILIFLKK